MLIPGTPDTSDTRSHAGFRLSKPPLMRPVGIEHPCKRRVFCEKGGTGGGTARACVVAHGLSSTV
jgi:hypothetical protein